MYNLQVIDKDENNNQVLVTDVYKAINNIDKKLINNKDKSKICLNLYTPINNVDLFSLI